MKTVVICDTEPVAIEGLRALLTGAELRVIAAEECLADGMDAVRQLEPTVVILDKGFGLHPVLDAVRALTFGAATRTIVWGATLTESEMLRLMHAGALGVIRKSGPLESLVDCVTTVAAGGTWMDGGRRGATDQARTGRSPLTARELQVADLVERGLTNREIALELGIRAGTVKIHLKHIFEKTGVRGRYGLAICGLRDKGVLLAPTVM